MTIISKVTQPGEGRVDSLGGNIALEEANNRLIVSDGTNRLALFGYDSDSEIVVKVAKPGFDADTATDEQLIFNSNQNIFKIVYTGSVSIASQSVSAGSQQLRTATFTFPRAFSSSPAVLAYGTSGSGYFLWSGTKFITWGVTVGSGVIVYRSDTFDMSISTSAVTFNAMFLNGENITQTAPGYTIKYYVLQESIS